ncbi:MAG: hypothetical protein JWP75_3118 [Frondihabitans sp.]|nr:hypothetical protein [Frondihabitans sp.]
MLSSPGTLSSSRSSDRSPAVPGMGRVDVESRERDCREPGSAPRWRIGVGAVVVAVLLLLAVGVAVTAVSSARGSTATDPGSGASVVSASAGARSRPDSSGDQVFVHVLGRVDKPGLYEVRAGARAIDVVTAAGGFTAEADQGAVNLARLVTDGEQIVVPAVGESPPAAQAVGGGTAGEDHASEAVVDLNTADAGALEALSGVGPATAAAIIDWRTEHGRFEVVDDLLDVRGIGAKKLEGFREQVVVR